MEKYYNKTIITFLFVIFYTLTSFAQTGKLYLEGKVLQGKKGLKGATIEIFESNRKIKSIQTHDNGKFSIDLDLNKDILVKIKKQGFITKKIIVNTKVDYPNDEYDFVFQIGMLPKVSGLDINEIKKPVTKISYNKKIEEFDYEKQYTEQVRAELNKLTKKIEELQKQDYNKVIQEADEAFRKGDYLHAINLYDHAIDLDPYTDYPDTKIDECERLLKLQENADANYKKAIATADKQFNLKKYQEAKKYYEKAKNIKPKETYPQTQIDKLNALLAEQNKGKEKEKQYNDAIKEADKLLASKKYNDAKSKYNDALGIKPNEQYPKDKIAEIEKTLSMLAAKQREAEKRKEYQEFIKKGDKLFAEKNYRMAKGAYNKAKNLMPNEQYPKNKIAEIEKIEAALAAATTKTVAKPKPKPKPKLKELKFKSSAERQKYLSDLAKKYPDRKTVENYTESNGKTIERIIMNNNGIAHEYRKIKQPWGDIYYFKDGQSIARSLYVRETK